MTELRGRVYTGKKRTPKEDSKECSLCGDAAQGDMVTEADLSLFQGQKGDPGLSPGQAHNGAKVGFRNPSSLPSLSALQERLHEPGGRKS